MLSALTRGLQLAFVAGVAGALVACNAEPAAPPCALCGELQVAVDDDDYSPGAWIGFSIKNVSSDVRLYDWCSVAARRRRDGDAEPWDTERRTAERCPGASGLDVAAQFRELAPGTSVRDSVQLRPSVFQGEYRVLVWLLTADGQVIAGNPVFSNRFEVLPSAP